MIRKHIRILYGLFGVLTVAFLILAVAVWSRSPGDVEKRTSRHLLPDVAVPIPAHEYAALQKAVGNLWKNALLRQKQSSCANTRVIEEGSSAR